MKVRLLRIFSLLFEKMLLAKYEEYKKRDPSTAIRFVLVWYKGGHCMSTGNEITEEKEIRALLTSEETKKKKEQKKKQRKKQKKI